jgi:hypothetical protein
MLSLAVVNFCLKENKDNEEEEETVHSAGKQNIKGRDHHNNEESQRGK